MAGVNRISRRRLLKIGATGTAAAGLGLALPAVVALPAVADDDDSRRRRVHIHGFLTNPDPKVGSVLISVTVDGPRHDLSGSGWDTGPDPTDVSGACYFSQAGSIDHGEVKLKGRAFFANTAAFKGALVKTKADLETGKIVFDFGGFIFRGTGTVVRD